VLQLNSHRPPFRLGSRGSSNEISLVPDLQMPVTLDQSGYMPSHTPLFLWKSIDPLVVTLLLAIRVVVAPSDMEACFCNTSLPSQDDHRNGHPHHPDPDFNRGARPCSRSISPAIQHSGLLCLASKATRHRSVNLLALRNPASSLLSVVHLPLTITILVIQTKSSHPSMHPIASPENKGLPDKRIVHSNLSPHDREAKRPWSVQFWNIK